MLTTAYCPCRRTASPQTQRTAARQQANRRCKKGTPSLVYYTINEFDIMKIIYIVFFIFYYTSLQAQIWKEDLPCGVITPPQVNETPAGVPPLTPEFDAPKIIPVVFHILHQSGVENVSREDILGILERLNQDYHKANPNLPNSPTVFKNQAADMEVVFKLATIDPDGNCTDGINRIYTNQTHFYLFDSPPVHWPTEKYLNIYICKTINRPAVTNASGLPSGLAGIASFPNPTDNFFDDWEGIFIGYFTTLIIDQASNPSFEGSFSTISHEVGHWLNLRHIWGDDNGNCSGSDFVNDTPNQADASYKCNEDFPFISCNNAPNGNMFCNFMDYGSCCTMFTSGQKDRVNEALNSSYRNQIWEINNLNATGALAGGTNFSCPTPPKADFAFNRDFLLKCEPDISLTLMERCFRAMPSQIEWYLPGGTPSHSTDFNITVSYPAAGDYNVTMIANNAYGADTLIRTLNVQTVPTLFYSNGSIENFENAGSIADVGAVFNRLGGQNFSLSNTTGYNSTHSLMYPQTLVEDFRATFITRKFKTTSADTILHFKVARASAYNASLSVDAEIECYPNYSFSSPLGSFRETALNSAPSNFNFHPTSTSEWKTISLIIPDSIRNREDVQFRFNYTGDYTQNFFIDDIQVASSSVTSVIAPSVASTFDLFPNPVLDGSFTYEIKGKPFKGHLYLYDAYGKLLIQQEVNSNSGTIDTKGIQLGIYFCQPVSAKTWEAFLPKKVVIF